MIYKTADLATADGAGKTGKTASLTVIPSAVAFSGGKLNYRQQLQTKEWKALRRKIIAAAGNKCEDCGYSGSKLEIHHCAYITGLMAHEYDRDLLICLCPACHQERQRQMDAVFVTLGRIMRRNNRHFVDKMVWSIIEQAAAEARAREAVKTLHESFS